MYPVSAKYLEAVRFSHRITVRLEAWRGGLRVDEVAYPDGYGIPFRDGEVVVDVSPGVRRTLSTTLPPAPGLEELLEPVGTELRPVSVLRYPDGEAEEVPLGRFPILGQVAPIGRGELKVDSAPDLFAAIQRGRLLRPRISVPGRRVTDTIVDLVRDVFGADWPAKVTATSTATVGALVWDRDRAKAILDLAASIGADVSFDVDGTLLVRDIPNAATARPVLTLATGAGGVIVGGARARSRRKTYNVVVAAGKVTDGTALYDPVIVWDNNPSSPTYAGPDPLNRPDLAGPFGVVPYFITNELLRTAAQATAAATAALGRVVGLEQQLSLTAAPNHALDGFDVVDVLVVGGRVAPRHVIDRVTHPLGADGDQAIDTRSSRPDNVTEEAA